MNRKLLWAGAVVIIAVVLWQMGLPERLFLKTYRPHIDPGAFSTTIDNPYFTLTPGTKFVYGSDKPEGHERTEVTVLNETRVSMGVTALVVKDQLFLNGQLIEDTLDWYAQDRDGNVWYFGEETAEYENGKVTTTAGSWEAGVNGALPGIVMEADPRPGDSYRQEYLKDEAEDMARVVALGQTATVPYGTYRDCVQTYDTTPLEPSAKEHKFYCKGIAFTALEINLEDNEREELVSVTHVPLKAAATPAPTARPSPPPAGAMSPTPAPSPTATPGGVTEAQAKAIALARVPGTVTDVAIETRSGKQVYVVEIQPSGGGAETDVVVNVATGEVLAVE